jgi:glutathione peroxidase
MGRLGLVLFPTGEFDMKLFVFACLVASGVLVMNSSATAKDTPKSKSKDAKASAESPLNVEMDTLDGKKVNLAEKYKGKVVLLVNVASKCGNTPQYKPLEALHEKYADQGLAIVGVPCNQFHQQEPGTAAEISEFCTKNYGVKFDMLSKVDVNGKDAAPLYKTLTTKESDPDHAGKITWNFEKFLFDRDGKVAARFAPKTQPDSPEVVKAIETELAKKK